MRPRVRAYGASALAVYSDCSSLPSSAPAGLKIQFSTAPSHNKAAIIVGKGVRLLRSLRRSDDYSRSRPSKLLTGRG